jgi:hypothetical protein
VHVSRGRRCERGRLVERAEVAVDQEDAVGVLGKVRELPGGGAGDSDDQQQED